MIEQLVVMPSETLEIGAERAELIVIHEALEIIEVGVIGPSGKKGDKGDKGDAGIAGTSAYEELEITSLVPTEHLLAHEPAESSLNVFVNGLRQHSSAFTRDVQTVSLLADLQLVEGDVLAFVYAY